MSARMPSTYPFEPTPEWVSVNPKPLLPFRTRREDLPKPPLPSPPRDAFFNDNYTVSTHIIPAACPRLIPDVPLPPAPEFSTDPLQRKQNVQQTATKIRELQALYSQGKFGEERSEKLLWNCVNRYAKRSRAHSHGKSGLTLLLVHANGFPKEIWEVTLQYLLSSPSASLIDEVWSWEAVQHGDAALLNDANISGIYDWRDNARDIAHFLLHYLPENAFEKALPTHLHLLPETVSDHRKANGFSSRSLVTVGHSFGGCSLVHAAVNFPALFSSMVLVDPVLVQNNSPYTTAAFLVSSLARRHDWPSREEALRLFKASPFFGVWDPSVTELYVTYGLCEDSKGGVKLKMAGMYEALVFGCRVGPVEGWELAERLDERIELRWIVPGKPDDKGISGEQATRERVWRRPANSSNVAIPSAGHLVVQESPMELAREISAFLENKYGLKNRALL